MAQSSFPFESIDTTETQFSQWARNIGEGVKGSLAGTELKVTAGTGLQVAVAAGQAMVRGHYYVSTASENLTIATANASNPRIDSIVLTLDPTANTIVLAVVAGTAASSPVAPTLTQTDSGVYQYQLATVLVPAAATSVSTITDKRTFLGSKSSASIATAVTTQSSNYTLTSADRNTFIYATAGITITVADVLAAGESVDVIQDSASQVTFTAGSGVTLLSADSLVKTAKQNAGVTVTCKTPGTYYLIGALG
jgi:hypothetical protein